MTSNEDIMKALRGACGFTEPVTYVVPPSVPPSHTEEASKRALEVWEWMLAKSGTIPDIGDK